MFAKDESLAGSLRCNVAQGKNAQISEVLHLTFLGG
jgi:hypothetical protein